MVVHKHNMPTWLDTRTTKLLQNCTPWLTKVAHRHGHALQTVLEMVIHCHHQDDVGWFRGNWFSIGN